MSRSSSSPFKVRSVLAIVLIGFLAFLAMLYFISIGDTGRGDDDGGAHAASRGLNGYAGLARLLESEGLDVTLSRSPSGFETYDLLVLTPPASADPEEIGKILEDRVNIGPTLVILPKWWAANIDDQFEQRLEEDVPDGWVRFFGSGLPQWTNELPAPFAFETSEEQLGEDQQARWSGFDFAGSLPEQKVHYAEPSDLHEAIVSDDAGHILALNVLGEQGSDYYNDAYFTVFVTEPDLVNNYGMAEREQAALALELVRFASADEPSGVTFDLSLNGLGAAQNLLTLAFRPPFLAATICLILALLVIGWRAFKRFGPAETEAPAFAFGKSRLVSNSAGLILRAKRLRLLTTPYVELSRRRIAHRLGVRRAEVEAIDHALARALPDETPFSIRADNLRQAKKPQDILRAAHELQQLERKLTT